MDAAERNAILTRYAEHSARFESVAARRDAVADVILEHHESGVALRQQAVLFRSAHHSDLLEVELHRLIVDLRTSDQKDFGLNILHI